MLEGRIIESVSNTYSSLQREYKQARENYSAKKKEYDGLSPIHFYKKRKNKAVLFQLKALMQDLSEKLRYLTENYDIL